MRNIRLIIQYDGSRYAGFQKLGPNHKGVTVCDKIEEVLNKMTNETVEVIGAIKLEAGVHALEQVANFKTNCEMKEFEMKHYLNQYLPRDIAVLQVDDVPERFHSSLNAKSYSYEYRITMGEVADVFARKYNYYSFRPLDVDKMREAAGYMTGVNDLAVFCNVKKMKKSTIREIFEIEIVKDIDRITIRIKGDDFWPYMARKMVGILIEAGKGQLDPKSVMKMIDDKKIGQGELLADAQGLFLKEVNYM